MVLSGKTSGICAYLDLTPRDGGCIIYGGTQMNTLSMDRYGIIGV